MKKKHMVAGFLVVGLIALLVPAIRIAVERHRRFQDMAILQKIGLKMSTWSVHNEETFPSLTNKSFLAILAPDEAAFLKANRVTAPSETNDYLVMQAQTAHGRFALLMDGSVMAIK